MWWALNDISALSPAWSIERGKRPVGKITVEHKWVSGGIGWAYTKAIDYEEICCSRFFICSVTEVNYCDPKARTVILRVFMESKV